MTDNTSVEFAHVTITIRVGNKEIVYDLPKVKNPITNVEYEDPVIRAAYPRVTVESQIKLFTISMQPFKVEDTFYTILTTNHGVDVES